MFKDEVVLAYQEIQDSICEGLAQADGKVKFSYVRELSKKDKNFQRFFIDAKTLIHLYVSKNHFQRAYLFYSIYSMQQSANNFE